MKRQRETTPPSGRRSSNGKREARQGSRAQPKPKKETSKSSSSSSSAARSTVLSSPSPPSSQALNSHVSSPRVLASSLSNSLSEFIRNFVWGGQSQQTIALSPSPSVSSRTASPSSSTSSSSLLSTSSSPRTLRQQLLNSTPHHILWSFLGFVALALGFHLRRGLSMGSRTLAQHAARLLHRIVQVVLLEGEKTGGR